MSEAYNPNSCAVRRCKLTSAIEIRLRALGGFVWRTQKTSAGLPLINCIIGGDYYGFYPSGINTGGAQDLSKVEKETVKRLREQYNANVYIVASIDSMEKVMGLNAHAEELRAALPTNKLAFLLEQWGKGKLQDSPIEAEILRLREDLRAVIFGKYLDGMTYNQIAAVRACSVGNIITIHHNALNIIRDALLTKGTYMEGMGAPFFYAKRQRQSPPKEE